MPWNKLAKSKYEKVGRGNLYQDMGDLTEEDLQNIINMIEESSFQVVINHWKNLLIEMEFIKY